MLGWAIYKKYVPIEWGLDYEKRHESHMFKENGYYLVSKPFSNLHANTIRLDVERYVTLKRATGELNKIRSQKDMEVGIILEHDDNGYTIEESSMANPSL